MARFYISVGANLGDREQSLRKAIDCLRRTEGIDCLLYTSVHTGENKKNRTGSGYDLGNFSDGIRSER